MKRRKSFVASFSRAKIDENGVRSSSGTTLGYPLHPWTLLVVSEVWPRKSHSLGGFWGLTCDTFLSFFSSCFVSAFLSCSFRAFATTRVPKVAKKGAKMEPKALPERLCDMCQKHGIYCTGSTSDPPGSVLKPDNSSNSCREAPWRVPEAHVCDSSTVLGPPLASILCSWSLRFRFIFWMRF